MSYDWRSIKVIEKITYPYFILDNVDVQGGSAVCGENMDLFEVGDSVIFALTWTNYSTPIDTLFLGGVCVHKYLRYQNGKVVGQIHEDIQAMEYEKFKTNPYDCMSSTATEESMELKIELFPNPVNDFLTINSNDLQLSEIEVISTDGNMLLSKQVNQVNFSNLDLSNFPPGIYFIKIRTRENEIVKKISKI